GGMGSRSAEAMPWVSSRVPPGSSLSLRNLTGGSAPVGGGVHNGGRLTVLNSRFSGNTATYAGGSIENDGGTITVIDSMFSGSSATAGGAIDSEGGTVTVANSSFSGNDATAGGGIERCTQANSMWPAAPFRITT